MKSKTPKKMMRKNTSCMALMHIMHHGLRFSFKRPYLGEAIHDRGRSKMNGVKRRFNETELGCLSAELVHWLKGMTTRTGNHLSLSDSFLELVPKLETLSFDQSLALVLLVLKRQRPNAYQKMFDSR